MWLVLDTNVIVAGLRSSAGASHVVLRAVRGGEVEIVVTVALLLEYEEVLHRESAALGLSPVDIETLVDGLAALAVRVAAGPSGRPRLPDPDDEHLLDAALAGEAEAILTHNVRALREAADHGIRVLTPGAWLKERR